jgi:putative DNA primase/helicase
MTVDGIETINEAVAEAEKFYPPGLRPVDLAEFLARDIPPREMLLDPVIPTQGLVMVFSIRGVGKTLFCLGAAYAIATGGPFLRYTAPKPRRVLYIDGEMPASTMQKRLAAIVKGADQEAEPGFFGIITPDMQDVAVPNLADPAAQSMLSALIERDGYDVVFLDSISVLSQAGEENTAESWGPMQAFALGLRRNGRSIVFVHHAGRNGEQRGTSKREDLLDTIIKLQRPPDYQPEEGARFEVHLKKARGIFGEAAKAFDARFETPDDAAVWTISDKADADLARLAALLNEGESIRDAAKEMKISKSKAARLKKEAAKKGLLREGE